MHRRLLFAALIVAIAVPCAMATTVDNLQAAFNGESNANARYLAFAVKADGEGYPSVASLFRAAAKAEEIHANNHAAVLKDLGVDPVKNIETPVVKTTAENLDVAIQGETYERDTMYPNFLKAARAEKAGTPVLRTFNYAKSAETGHAKLYTDAKKNLAQLKGAEGRYYVCGICGYTVSKINFEKCPACGNPKDKYFAVS